MNVTQKEMAEKLNVSQSQVARALSGGGRVAEETRQRVLKMASELGYDATSNSAARALAGKRHGQTPRNGIVAVMYEALLKPRSMPFFEPVFNGMEDEALELGLDVCLCQARPHEIPRLVRERKVDGVISLGYRDENMGRVEALDMPLVLFHDMRKDTHCAMPDDYDAACQATEHLLKLGHRRIAFLGVQERNQHPVKMRLQGYRDTMARHGLPVPDGWLIDDLFMPDTTANSFCSGCERCAACIGWRTLKERIGFSGAAELPFTALVCYNDAVAMGAITYARADGFEAPAHFSVVGFDNVSDNYHFLPRITSVDFSLYQLGRETLRLLNQVVQEQAESPAGSGEDQGVMVFRQPVFPVHLAVHESTRAVTTDSVSGVCMETETYSLAAK